MKRDIPDINDIVAASSEFLSITGYYPGSGPDGSGETLTPDGPFLKLSPMLFDVEANGLPEYITDVAAQEIAEAPANTSQAPIDENALERDLMRELGLDDAKLSGAESQPQGNRENIPSDDELADAIEALLNEDSSLLPEEPVKKGQDNSPPIQNRGNERSV